MQLINGFSLPSAVLVAKEQLFAISKLIDKHLGREASDKFMAAVQRIDSGTVNDILDLLIIKFTGIKETMDALYAFIDKFPELNPELHDAAAAKDYEYDIVLIIDKYYDDMKRIMEGG